MPEISPSRGAHWHKDGRTKTCVICENEKPLSDFYAYSYTTRQGKQSTRYESRCRPCAQARRRAAYHANQESEAEKHRAWYAENRDRQKAYMRERRKNPAHKAIKAYHQRLRKARIRSGQPDCERVREIYKLAIATQELVKCCPVFAIDELGYEMQVDHIIPLARGGQHVADNLQILPIGLNMRKGVSCPK